MMALYTAQFKRYDEWHWVRIWDTCEVGRFLTRDLAERAALRASDCGEIRINEEPDELPAEGVPVFCSTCHQMPCDCKTRDRMPGGLHIEKYR